MGAIATTISAFFFLGWGYSFAILAILISGSLFVSVGTSFFEIGSLGFLFAAISLPLCARVLGGLIDSASNASKSEIFSRLLIPLAFYILFQSGAGLEALALTEQTSDFSLLIATGLSGAFYSAAIAAAVLLTIISALELCPVILLGRARGINYESFHALRPILIALLLGVAGERIFIFLLNKLSIELLIRSLLI